MKSFDHSPAGGEHERILIAKALEQFCLTMIGERIDATLLKDARLELDLIRRSRLFGNVGSLE
jgi:hypothetical protein